MQKELMNFIYYLLGRVDIAPGGGAPNKNTPDPPPRMTKLLLGGVDPPPRKTSLPLGGVDPPLERPPCLWGGEGGQNFLRAFDATEEHHFSIKISLKPQGRSQILWSVKWVLVCAGGRGENFGGWWW